MNYLNNNIGDSLYRETIANPFFVDKTALLTDLISLIGSDAKYLCMTRPRRLGKTVMANMIASFFNKGVDSSDVFDRLTIARTTGYQKHLNIQAGCLPLGLVMVKTVKSTSAKWR